MKYSFITDTPKKLEIMKRLFKESGFSLGSYLMGTEAADSLDIGYSSSKLKVTFSSEPYGRNFSDFVYDVRDPKRIASYLNNSLDEKELRAVLLRIKEKVSRG